MSHNLFAEEKRPRFGFEPSYWFTTLEGEIAVNTKKTTGSDINVVEELGLDKRKGIPGAELWFGLGKRQRLSLSYFEAKYEGKKILDQPIIYKGTTLPAGTNVSSRLKTRIGSLAYQVNFIQRKMVELGFLFGIDYFYFDFLLKQVSPNPEVTEGPLPVVGLANRINFGKHLSWDTKVSGMQVSMQDTKGSFIDGCSGLTYNFSKNWGVGVGYRYLGLEVIYDKEIDSKVDFTLNGPSAFFTGRF